ncbi:UNVERIFIED_CONTAM: hypothetical protein GTU68_002888 [Idotea baltica]|nr:hypothetical protein [Idotea baltica]
MSFLDSILKVFVGDKSKQDVKALSPIVKQVKVFEAALEALSHDELRAKTIEFKAKIAEETVLNDILPEAFAVVKETAKRFTNNTSLTVTLIGGVAMHQGKIAEMHTGEGKTLVATLPVYLNALSGRGVHLVTVNDYLAKRDSAWMAPIFEFHGMTVDCIDYHQPNSDARKKAYNSDITYGTNNEFGFDYLRDNMAHSPDDLVQRPHHYAIVDEVDSVLVDDARTPLIISGPIPQGDRHEFTELKPKVDDIVSVQRKYLTEEKNNQVELTDKGIEYISGKDNPDFFEFGVKSERIHTLNQLLKAYALFEKDTQYVVMDNKVMIVDEQTGRIMDGRRYSDGLHQAIEAKENVKIEDATQTFATVTLQNYFRMYRKLSGMTGTAVTEAGEFWEIYKLDVVEIPTNRPIARDDKEDLVYKTKREKYNAVIDDVTKLSEAGRPVLIGTTSVEISELLGKMLSIRKIPHNVLNAKQHKKEAEIVDEAGQSGQVTIATNMAGRGTDIKLSDAVKAAGGLAIVGTERHDSRRVDRQLRGRAGRQGDVGSSQFYVSLEDNLMRLFGSERIAKMMDRMGLKEGEVIQHSMISKSIERAQKKVEENNFGVRKRLLEYDDVMNAQREVVYKRRHHALFGERLRVDLANMIFDTSEVITESNKGANDFKNLEFELIRYFSMSSPVTQEEFEKLSAQEITGKIYKAAFAHYKDKMAKNADIAFPVIKNVYENQRDKFKRIVVPFTDGVKSLNVVTDLEKAYETQGKQLITDFEKNITLAIIDDAWKTHLRKMDELKQSVQLAVHEQKDPLLIYKFEAFELFKTTIDQVNKDVISFLFKGELPQETQDTIQEARETRKKDNLKTQKDEIPNLDERSAQNRAAGNTQRQPEVIETIVRDKPKIGRNDRVTIKHVMNGENKTVKYKQAEPLLAKGEWVLVEE